MTAAETAAPGLAEVRWKFPPAILQAVALSPVIWWFANRLDDGNDEPLGLLTLALALVLSWRDRATAVGNPFPGAALILISALGIHWLPPMVRAALGLGGLAIYHGLQRRAGVVGLLALSLPVAASMQFFLGYPLRVAAAEGTVRLLELASVSAVRAGAQIELGGRVIGVDPACGGVRMLWHALAAAMALAAIHRLTWRATMLAGLLAIALIVPANICRAALLAVTEAGYFPANLLGHAGTGVLAFAVVLVPLWVAIARRARPGFPEILAKPRGNPVPMLAAAALLAPVLMFATPRTPQQPVAMEMPAEFTFDGLTLPLEKLPQTPEESAFSLSFPGTLASFRWGKSQVVLRSVTEATRRLHASRDCLRAAGFTTTDAVTARFADGTRWAKFHATRDGMRRTVFERISSGTDDSAWTDVSAWYWSALRHPLNGPWRAETVIIP